MLHKGVHAPIRLLTAMWHVGRPTAAIHLEVFRQTWLHCYTQEIIMKVSPLYNLKASRLVAVVESTESHAMGLPVLFKAAPNAG